MLFGDMPSLDIVKAAVVAFGDNVPAFLRIPVPVSRKAS